MSRYLVIVRKPFERHEYTAIALCAADAASAAYDTFGACAVTVRPA